MINKSKKFRCWQNLTGAYDLVFEENILLVKVNMPYTFKCVKIVNKDGNELYSESYLSNECECKLNLLPGKYYFYLYGSKNGVSYEAYIGGKQIIMELDTDSNWYFVLPVYSKWNRYLIENGLLDYVLCDTFVDNNHTMKRIANKLTAGCNSIRKKVLAIHDFVAQNIYYDYDSLVSNENRYRTIEQIAKNKRCICQGYADFTLVLLACVGIEVENILCYVVGNIYERGWSNIKNRTSELNHIITRVKLENRWLYMDVTWDSNNRYENGKYIKGANISHRYFDVTLPFLSTTHRFFEKKP
ncbi:transglutaminase domain-containing protein [Bacteroides thetaiotaomicron]|uniref:transglutaminase domain-containing protein n=1 Tax=Bacteroides thetaiotaomicron TaxID=818 RepID=UPI00232EAFDF|nr:transglutaminase domain-containing protein [Bacteroides thetaiotaomicron]MDC2009060.1 transglutaminase domain-containing protein [Bacteroides thetaiotaomicron]MDC2023222.1 transglutaminase domain-containing protein [Bacteroides thetaiotaomicron]MDC2025804.1 transglutaminase domain-containing protein [Bacteroides thetaiotaomicron]MDC2032314.1 transglutaminase domain-containing protein [Bacteroides thetaiotaomicron]MDC2063277.1 transglutaminase domain-containing protein [Bacteroides thetaiota